MTESATEKKPPTDIYFRVCIKGKVETVRSLNTYNYTMNIDSQFELIALTLYWAEGSKYRKRVELTNSDPKAIKLFSKFLLEICDVPQDKLKGRLQIHNKDNIDSALKFWSELSKVPQESIIVSLKPIKVSNKTNKHINGIFSIRYNSVGLKSLIDESIERIKCLDP